MSLIILNIIASFRFLNIKQRDNYHY